MRNHAVVFESFKEVHHRVKNNFSIISSLLNLQSTRINEPEVRQILLQSQASINSMAMVHEQLYQSEDIEHINLKYYVDKLVNDFITILLI